jgi:hypothetical protein
MRVEDRVRVRGGGRYDFDDFEVAIEYSGGPRASTS